MEKLNSCLKKCRKEVDFFFVLEQTKVNGISYILVTDSKKTMRNI